MVNLERVKNWGREHEFSEEHLEYTVKLAVKILDEHCKMSDEEKMIFMAVYDGILERENTPFTGSLHQIIQLAKADNPIVAGAVYKEAIHEICEEMLKTMFKPIMKGYKGYVRKHIALLE